MHSATRVNIRSGGNDAGLNQLAHHMADVLPRRVTDGGINIPQQRVEIPRNQETGQGMGRCLAYGLSGVPLYLAPFV